MKSKKLVFLVAAFVLLFAQAGFAQEDVSKYPSKPITYVCPVPPGSGVDLSTRLLAKELEKTFGQPVIVVNKPGGALTVGTTAVATAKHDGYTIGFTGGPPLYFSPFLIKVPYDPLNDLRFVAQYAGSSIGVVVKADSPFKTFKGLIEYARKNPKKVTYGTTGTNSITHITMERIAKQENVQMIHIPFEGTPKTQVALLGGHVTAAAGDFGAALVTSNQMKLLLMLKEEKSAEYPDVPILKDLGYDVPYPMVNAVITGKGVPDAIVKKLDDAVARATKSPAFLKGLKDLRLPVLYRSGKAMDKYLVDNYEYYEKVFKEMGVTKK